MAPSMLVARDLPGQSLPTGFFDPIGFTKVLDEKTLKVWREAELKHGRVAMLASVGMLTAERWNPLFGGKISGASIYHFQQIENIYNPFWIIVLSAIGLVEFFNISKGWETQDEKTTSTAMLKENYVPGDLGFDPLGLRPANSYNYEALSPEFVRIRTKELNNGRLAMIGVAGMIAQELVDKNTIWGHFAQHGFGRATYGM
eukprot:CAMPEP_0170059846 /NCGR_PEP_ID=MMETSP0019_2-20121128/1987_1 /TAXON_ID=98059 /ORGANISM="Dinobryon sp., Strain UTEXLB2267" /LENGTH=200 /DNA_ID=CAMNT_0010265231 /DNA_START=862 /DNA_END=1464 /DNA_ORIENTATION=+